MSSKHLKTTHLLMLTLIVIWTADIFAISESLKTLDQVFLLCSRYICAFLPITLFVLLGSGLKFPNKRDLPMIFLSAFLGDLGYFYFEYTALKYVSSSLVTVVISFLPALSVISDGIFKKEPVSIKMLIKIAFSIAGIVLILVGDIGIITSNSIKGIALAFICIAIWVLYGYVTTSLDHYSSKEITVYQMVAGIIIMLPLSLRHIPSSEILFSRSSFIGICIFGIVVNGFGSMIEIRGLVELGTTITGIYINLLPVFTIVAEMLLLGIHLSLLQYLGAVLVIVFSMLIVLDNSRKDIKKSRL